MNGDLVGVLVNAGGIAATVFILWWAVARLSSGDLISRKMHDEILAVYRAEAQKLTNGMEDSIKELKEMHEEDQKRTVHTRGEMLEVTNRIIQGLNNIEQAIKGD